MKKPKAVPVLMYHSVAEERPEWLWSHLITPVDLFEKQMRLLKEKGWNTITLSQLHSHMKNNTELPDKPVVLTFDDGYLDNRVYAYPILKKYGHHAVIWMSTDFIDPSVRPRPTLEDVWEGRLTAEELPGNGFLSVAEMREMEGSGTIEIQSHLKTHTWYFQGPEVVDYHRPAGTDGYEPHPWLSWNAYPEKKYDYMSRDFAEDIPPGTPVYRYERSVNIRRYFPDERVALLLVRHVADNGGNVFFSRKDWREELDSIVRENPPSGDRVETEEEYEERIREEIAGSRDILSEKLGGDIRFLCWPGGGFNETALRIASESGYSATTTDYGGSGMKNIYGERPDRINRIGCGVWSLRSGLVISRTDPGFFIAMLEDFTGKKLSIWKLRCYKIKYLVRYYLTGVK
ncbi:MAG: polysaccharide deacetylase family protein [Candidatus Krumholzibacteriota bacterium]|nr:polysaccharide deacetylase family protein [Candidatus Krumholzibacteriota bacterium]